MYTMLRFHALWFPTSILVSTPQPHPPPLTEDANNLAFHCTLPLIMANFLEYQFFKFFKEYWEICSPKNSKCAKKSSHKILLVLEFMFKIL